MPKKLTPIQAAVKKWATIISQFPTTWPEDRAIWVSLVTLSANPNIEQAVKTGLTWQNSPRVEALIRTLAPAYLKPNP